jgi:rhodanese-related sulfurtransferase
MTKIQTITPQRAADMIKDGGVLIDIRNADEHARERISGATHSPLGADAAAVPANARYAIFHCRSGMRTAANAATLSQSTPCEAFILEGGLDAWKRAGLPVEQDKTQPLELMRQVQITAGMLVLIGAILGFSVHPAFYGLSAFVGAGLTFAGVSGWCGMAHLLRIMPWNRALAA